MIHRRSSGIVLAVTALPSKFGIGDLGPAAYDFADFLDDSRQSLWQVLPLNAPNSRHDNSPYSSKSAFAGNPALISPELLFQDGLLTRADLKEAPSFPADHVDYRLALQYKDLVLERAWQRSRHRLDKGLFEQFCHQNAYWLDDFANFVAISRHFDGRSWNHWPADIRHRSIKAVAELVAQLHEEIEKEKVLQYLFQKQWVAIRQYCSQRGIHIIGDLTMFVAYNSADVWSRPDEFLTDDFDMPTVVAGYPPSRFNRRGQVWNTPVYDWEMMRQRKYSWWIRRIEQALKLYDFVRVDHFRGFVMVWEVPIGDRTAIRGKWAPGPGRDLLDAVHRQFGMLPLVPENLGDYSPEVQMLIRDYDLPDSCVIQFAFGSSISRSPHAPHNYIPNNIAYTTTHDTNTMRGWFEQQASLVERQSFFDYVGREVPLEDVAWESIRLVTRSVATLVVIPLQDVMSLGAEARFNRPGTIRGNWVWRYQPEQLEPELAGRLADLSDMYGRA